MTYAVLLAIPLILATQDKPSGERIRTLVEKLGSGSIAEREAAARTLVNMGEASVDALDQACRSEDREVASRAGYVLRKIFSPLESLWERERKKLSEVETLLAELQKKGSSAEARELQEAYRDFRRRIMGWDRPAGKKPEPRVHVVGLYEGKSDTDQVATVTVTATDHPVILVLCAYESVWWTVNVAKGASVERIILGGYKHQEIEKAPTGLKGKVEKHVYEDGDRNSSFRAYSRENESYPDAIRSIRKLTGREISTFQGAYRYPGVPIEVGPDSADWASQRIIPALDELHLKATRKRRQGMAAEMRKIRFKALWLRMDERFRMVRTSVLGEFSPLGPEKDSMKNLAKPVLRLAMDAKTGRAYGLTHHDLYKIDILTGTVKKMTVERRKDLPPVSWPSGIALDAKRNRLLLLNHNGGAAMSYLYACDLETGKWSNLAEMGRHPKLGSLAWSAYDDALYGIQGRWGRRARVKSVQMYTANGVNTGEVILSEPIQISQGDRDSVVQIVPVSKDRIVIIAGPMLNPDPGPRYIQTATLVDTKTGNVIFTCRQQPQ